ncbi:MAG: hypothetical protein AAFU78_20935, partial [Cyanobacteria bacterium J06633_2]
MAQHQPNSFPPQRSNPSPDTSDEANLSSQPASVPGWQTVEFPNAVSADASQRQAHYAQSMTRKSTAHSGQVPKSSAPSSTQSAEGLIALIQDTNQRNHELMDRVAQLEEALEQSRQALQQELDQAQGSENEDQPSSSQVDASQQVNYLLNQLEFVQQANQRQEILVETLTEQLESSHTRVAQLEDDCLALQDAVNRQSVQLQDGDRQCRDLQARLQRQQQYTLQFKVALDKCLEVPPPSYETSPSPAGDDDSENLTSSQVSIPPIPLAEGAMPQSYSSQASTDSTHIDASKASASLNEPIAENIQDRVALTDSLLPKANHIKPWSVGDIAGESQSLESQSDAACVSGLTPAQTSRATTTPSSSAPDLFSARFQDTLRDLVQTDLAEPVDASPVEEERSPQAATERQSLAQVIGTADTVTTSDSDVVEALEMQSDESAESTVSDAELAQESESAQASEPSWFKWRSFLPPDLRQSGDRQKSSNTPEDVEAESPSSERSSEAIGPNDDSDNHRYDVQLPGESSTYSDSSTARSSSLSSDALGASLEAAFSTPASPSEKNPPELNIESFETSQHFDAKDVANLVNATAEEIARIQQTSELDSLESEPPKPLSLTEIFEQPSDVEARHADTELPIAHQSSSDSSAETSPDPWTTSSEVSPSNSSAFGKIESIPTFSVNADSNDSDPLLAIARPPRVNLFERADADQHLTQPNFINIPSSTESTQLQSPVAGLNQVSNSDASDAQLQHPEDDVVQDKQDAPEVLQTNASDMQTSPEVGDDSQTESTDSTTKKSPKEISLYTPQGDRSSSQQRPSLSSLILSISSSPTESKEEDSPSADSQVQAKETLQPQSLIS